MSNSKITVIVEPFFQNNQLFNEFNLLVNRDDCQRPWIELKKELSLNGVDVDTIDITPINEADIVMFINIPKENDWYFKEAIKHNKLLFCAITELDLIHKNNSRSDLVNLFDRVFTYQSSVVDNKKIFKINYSFDFKEKYKQFNTVQPSNRKKLVTLIAGNKKLKHNNELYSKRVEAIRWFEKNHPLEFDLYGVGWNRVMFLKRILINYKSFGFLRSFIPDYFASYLGPTQRKDEILKTYNFSFCFENAFDADGWITEKVFDSLFSGCVPIYWGDAKISSIIPKSCFIDKRDFDTYEQLYGYISKITDDEFKIYLKNIESFLKEKAGDPSFEFGVPYFVDTIKSQTLKILANDQS